MTKPYSLSIVAPERTIVEDRAVSLIAPAVTGYMGVWHGHQPMIVELGPGLVEYIGADNQRHFVSVTGGFMEVTGDAVIILADGGERAEEIDLRAAEEALERARRALRGESSDMTVSEAKVELERALARVKAARRS